MLRTWAERDDHPVHARAADRRECFTSACMLVHPRAEGSPRPSRRMWRTSTAEVDPPSASSQAGKGFLPAGGGWKIWVSSRTWSARQEWSGGRARRNHWSRNGGVEVAAVRDPARGAGPPPGPARSPRRRLRHGGSAGAVAVAALTGGGNATDETRSSGGGTDVD